MVLAAGAGLLISANVFRDKGPGDISEQSPAPSEASPRPSLNPTSSPKQIAAACQIGGEIVFLDKNIYENKNAKIAYQNVDDIIRQIFWKLDPDDGALVIGPNLFEELPIPNGKRNIGVAFKKDPTAKNYTLTASITYGVKRADGAVEERIAGCAGKVKVDTSGI